MSFLYPSFLFALLAIAIPIIIHLFNFRKFTTVYFSNVEFLKEVNEETIAVSKLKHLLVLVARILAIIFLVLAFSQPFIPTQINKIHSGGKVISVFIDNSFSMNAINENGTLLDEAKKNALEIVTTFKPTDQFQLLTNDFEGKHQRLVSKEEFASLLDEIKISSKVRTISEITSRQKDILQNSKNNISNVNEKNKLAFIISDFQKSNFNVNLIKNDTNVLFNLVPVIATDRNNIYIDTCWFETPVRQFNQIEKLHVVIKNTSNKDLEYSPIKLFINDIQKTLGSYSIENGSEAEVVLTYITYPNEIKTSNLTNSHSALMNCRLEINDSPISFDDTFYISYELAKNISVLCINSSADNTENSGSPFINKLFQDDSLFILKNTDENLLDYSSLFNNQLIVLNELKIIPSGLSQELTKFTSNGGNLLVFPNSNCDLKSYKDFLILLNANYFESLDTSKTKTEKINLEHPIFKDVFDKKKINQDNLYLPIVYKHFIFSKTTKTNQDFLLKLQNGDILLSQFNYKKGKVYLSSIPLQQEFSNFAKHALFVPTLYKIAINSRNTAPLFYTIGSNENIELTSNLPEKNICHVKSLNSKFDIIPEKKIINSKTVINVRNQIINDGNYNIFFENKLITCFALNHNRSESNLACFNYDELNEKITANNLFNFNIIKVKQQHLKEYISNINQGEKLWKFCIFLSLVFFAIEFLLLRFVKG
jgi:hypothetical protein